MIIGSKVALIESQLIDRKEKGIKYIELHTQLKDFEDIQTTLNKKVFLRQLGLTVYALRPPLINSKGTTCALGESNGVLRKENLNLIKKTVILADKLSDLSSPVVIIRIGGLVLESEKSPLFLKNKKELVRLDLWDLRNYVFQNYPNVTILIENNPRMWQTDEGKFVFGYGYEDDMIHWLKAFNDPHLAVSLNIAFAKGTIQYNQEHFSNSYFSSIYEFIHSYAPFLKLIHLSNGIGFVTKPDESYLPFLASNSSDVQFVRDVFNAIHQIKYNHPITIETKEDDDNNALNFIKTKECIVQSLKR